MGLFILFQTSVGQVQGEQSQIIDAVANGVRNSVESRIRQVVTNANTDLTEDQIIERVVEQTRNIMGQTMG